MKLSLTALLVGLGVLSPAAAAQFSQFEWTLSAPWGGVGHVSETEMGLDGQGLQEGGVISYTTTSPVAGRIKVQALVDPTDGVCTHEELPASIAALVVNDQQIPYATCTFGGTLSFDVVENEPFGLSLQCLFATFPYATSYAQFQFTPYWAPGGGSLPGLGGEPELTGFGVLQPGQPMGVRLTRAAPGALATLVIGFVVAEMPFKGGVLVPKPEAVVAGLVTDAFGTVELTSTWPDGIPVPLLMQAWITDPVAVQGFAASNALEARIL
jgi:hypothetical protein